jgi:hypothetical protein
MVDALRREYANTTAMVFETAPGFKEILASAQTNRKRSKLRGLTEAPFKQWAFDGKRNNATLLQNSLKTTNGHEPPTLYDTSAPQNIVYT